MNKKYTYLNLLGLIGLQQLKTQESIATYINGIGKWQNLYDVSKKGCLWFFQPETNRSVNSSESFNLIIHYNDNDYTIIYEFPDNRLFLKYAGELAGNIEYKIIANNIINGKQRFTYF